MVLRSARVVKAKRTVIDGIHFPSKCEAKRYQELLWLQHAGMISELSRQVSFPFYVNKVLICKWRVDFTFIEDGKPVAYDAGPVDREKQIKINLMKACYPEWIMRHE